MENKEFIKSFELMKDRAELKALSNFSLENPLTDTQFNRMKELKEFYKLKDYFIDWFLK